MDAWLLREIDDALRPYVGLCTEAELAWMKERLVESATNGAARPFARGAAPRHVVESGEVGEHEVADAHASISAKRGVGGK